MRTTLAISVTIAGIALATGMSAPAYADDTDTVFIKVLDDQGISYPSAKDAIKAANQVCGYLAGGNSLTDATMKLSDSTGLGVEDAGFFVGAATASYCPSHSP